MSRILLKTTIPPTADDWHIGRFSLLAGLLRTQGHDVTARDLDQQDGTDVDLRRAADGGFDQVWLLGVDGSGALGPPDIALIDRFRSRGGGLLLSRDHQDLGACLASIPGVGLTSISTPQIRKAMPSARPPMTPARRPWGGPTIIPATTATCRRSKRSIRCTRW